MPTKHTHDTEQYDYVFVTHLPTFYKVNLYNELSKHLNIFVIFISENTLSVRSNDFLSQDNIKFSYTLLNNGFLESRPIFKSIIMLRRQINRLSYKRISVNGWELPEFWYIAFSSPSPKNCLVLESTIIESDSKSIKSLIKKAFLLRISTVFASGKLHTLLLEELNYKRRIVTTKGVGIINKPNTTFRRHEYRKRFLYIGRLSNEKNLNTLVNVFNNLADFTLTIVGDGPLRKTLEAKSKQNIVFKGIIDNRLIPNIFDQNDVLILPSTSEPWGLVVEEALYYNVPVILSTYCGVSELVSDGINGYLICPNNTNHIRETIVSIDPAIYNELVNNCISNSLDDKDNSQINAYLAAV